MMAGRGGSGAEGCQKRSHDRSSPGQVKPVSASAVPDGSRMVGRLGGHPVGRLFARSSRSRPSSVSRSRPRQRKIRKGSSSKASASR